MKYWKSLLAASVLAVSGAASVQGAELIVLTGMGSYSGVRDVAAGFEKATGYMTSPAAVPFLAQTRIDPAKL